MPFSQNRAARYTKVAQGADADTAIESGGTITVYGITLCHHGKADEDGSKFALFEEYNSSTEIMRILVPPGETVQHEIQWLAHRGVQVSLDAFYLDCTIFHSHSGS